MIFSQKVKVRVILASVLVGILGFAGNLFLVKSQTPPTVKYVVAKGDIQMGTVISTDKLTTVTLKGQAPSGSIKDPKEIDGKVAVVPIVKDEPVLNMMYNEKAVKNGLEKDKMGVWVPVELGTAGNTKPGDIVAAYAGLVKLGDHLKIVNMLDNSGKAIETGVPAVVQLEINPDDISKYVNINSQTKVKLFQNPWGVNTPEQEVAKK